jgi:hypothetical protein
VHQEHFVNDRCHRRLRLVRNSDRECSARAGALQNEVNILAFARLRNAYVERVVASYPRIVERINRGRSERDGNPCRDFQQVATELRSVVGAAARHHHYQLYAAPL